MVDEVARELLEKKPEMEINPDFQDYLFREQIKRELQAVSTEEPIVFCDRGSVDIVAYSRLFGHKVKPEWLAWCRTYDKVFLLNREDVLFTDDIIRADPQYSKGRNWIDFRNSIEHQIVDVLSDLQISYTMLSGSTDQRFLRISREMDGLKTLLESGSVQRERVIR